MARSAATRWMPIFEEFLSSMRISSKEVSSPDERGVPLILWDSQRRFLSEIATGLDQGVRTFYCLKSRQLGCTTIGLAIMLFWVAFHDNLTAALVTEDEKNRDKNRAILRRYIESFPQGYFGTDFYIIKGGDNRNAMRFSNGSRIDFKVAGTREKGSSWAEGEGYAAAMLTECAAYGSPAALASFEEAFSQANPDRLYIFESTAKGWNNWRTKWYSGFEDPYTKRSFFVGWWSSDVNLIPRSDPRYLKYGTAPASGAERERMLAVQERFGHKITPEQLAWRRWKDDTATTDTEGMLEQNQPSLPEEAFVLSGSSFFQTRMIQKDWQTIIEAAETVGATAENPYAYEGFRYRLDGTFFDMKLEKMSPDDDDFDVDNVELRIWEQPVDGGEYVIGMDPAWGLNEHSDCHVASVWRCYADKMVQVAEYAANNVEVKHAAWVLAHLAGAYIDCIVNVELTGGAGRVIMMEWDTLRQQLQADANFQAVRARDWESAMQMARWYLYNRPDTMGRGYAANFECLALHTPLPTPSGWTTMGEVREGDFLLSDAGEPTKVVGASDIKLNAKCYQIEFDDGTTIVADANHQWKVARRHWKGVDRLRRTEQLEAGKFYVRTAYPLQLPDMELPIDPYVLGAWLGDGTSAGASITAGDQDVEEMVANIEACGQPTQVHWYHHCWRIGLNDGNNGSKGNPFMRSLRQLGVLNNKHIPDTYLRASFDQRLALLQGLMDTDGAAGGNGGPQCEFVTTSEPLAAGFAELVRSLGFKAKSLTLDESATHPTMRCCKLRRQFWFTAYPEMPVFRLKRKLDQSNQRERTHRFRPCHRIKSIREVDSVPVRCVVVDGPTSMFLAGAGMIPTHNSTWRTKQEIMYGMRGAYTTRELAIRSKPLLEEMRIVEQNGDQIAAPNNENDDRVIATALAIRAWTNWRRGPLLSRGLTYERVRAEEAGTSTLHSRSLNGLVARFLLSKEQQAELRDDRPAWAVERGLM